jgi:hypothetical protein
MYAMADQLMMCQSGVHLGLLVYVICGLTSSHNGTIHPSIHTSQNQMTSYAEETRATLTKRLTSVADEARVALERNNTVRLCLRAHHYCRTTKGWP